MSGQLVETEKMMHYEQKGDCNEGREGGALSTLASRRTPGLGEECSVWYLYEGTVMVTGRDKHVEGEGKRNRERGPKPQEHSH